MKKKKKKKHPLQGLKLTDPRSKNESTNWIKVFTN